MHHQIDSLAYTNRLRSLPPSHKVGWAIALFVLGFVSWMGVQGAIAFWLAIWIIFYAGIPAKIYGQLLLIPLTFWLLSVPALVLGISFSGNVNPIDIAWGWRYFYLSQQGISQAQIIFMRAIALTSCLYFILLTTPFADILHLLKAWRFPTVIIELLALMYRFIFVLTDTVLELVTAQKSRMGYRNRRSQLRSLGIIISQLLWRTLENYRACSLGLISRGFNGELRFWSDREYKANPRYMVEAIAGYFLLVLLAILPYLE